MVHELCAKGIRMNEEKFGLFQAMDGYGSCPDVEGAREKEYGWLCEFT
ncbi:hypothetical protein Tco_0823064, partial [Tanacetum coccineum]